jgi:hypothetical protein
MPEKSLNTFQKYITLLFNIKPIFTDPDDADPDADANPYQNHQ